MEAQATATAEATESTAQMTSLATATATTTADVAESGTALIAEPSTAATDGLGEARAEDVQYSAPPQPAVTASSWREAMAPCGTVYVGSV